MKIFNKKVSLGIGLATLFIVASCVYSLGYKMAMNKFNNMVSYTNEKQKIYSDLSEIDYNMRNEYIGNIDESKILSGISDGYFSALEDDNCKLLNKNEYQEYLKKIDSYQAEITWDKLNDSIGYLDCKTFGKGSADSFLERLDYFSSNGINNIILDLRLSEKGNIDEIVKILQYILPENEGIYSVDKSDKKEIICQSSSNNNSNNFKFLILTSNITSGCSEILALSLKDILGAKTIGEITCGNTVKEKIVEISENTVIIFPNAKYVTSQGGDIYAKGLNPDIEINISDEKINSLKENTLSYEDDECVQKAIDIFSA